ncbi:MAG: hypothetical protein ABGZ23_23495 [Fuerstiella sp.]|nr:hypothetical protein [Fuerstiella sp.]
MRRVLLIGWVMLLPLGGLYHLVAGPEHQDMDNIGKALAEAREMVGAEKFSAAVAQFEEALKALPVELVDDSRSIRLEMAQAKMNAARLPESNSDLKTLLDEMLADENRSDEGSDVQFEQAVRESLANSQFYMTWLMRLEGLSVTEWEPEIESARQNYRMLAENAERAGQSERAQKQRENLEATIRLARLDLTDLQGLPLPNQ